MRRRNSERDFLAESIDSFRCDKGLPGGGDAVGGIDGGGEAQGNELLFADLSLHLGAGQGNWLERHTTGLARRVLYRAGGLPPRVDGLEAGRRSKRQKRRIPGQTYSLCSKTLKDQSVFQV